MTSLFFHTSSCSLALCLLVSCHFLLHGLLPKLIQTSLNTSLRRTVRRLSPKMPAMSAKHLVQEAFDRVDARHGTPYPCRQEDLDFIRHHPSRNDGPFVSPRQATLEVVQHNDLRRQLPSYERDALRRLSNAVHHASRHRWGPDLAIKTFLDLDVVFFGGSLGGYVCVSWKGMATGVFADGGESQGCTSECPRPGHALIQLNAEAILLGPSPFSHMFSTVLHEMCVSIIHQVSKKRPFHIVDLLANYRQHAFEIVRVDFDERLRSSDGHDAEFGTRIHAVDRRAKELLGLEAIAHGEHWPRYQVGARRHHHRARA